MLRNAKITAFLLAALLAVTQPLAADHPEVVGKILTYLKTARTESADWPVPPKK